MVSVDRNGKGRDKVPTEAVRLLTRRSLLQCLLAPAWAAGSSWPEFRGDGTSRPDAEASLAVQWADGSNLAWSVSPPGYGQSSPVVWDGRVFLTAVRGASKEELLVSAWDALTGSLVWSHVDSPAQVIEDSDMVSRAAPTPAVDEDGLYAFFETGNVLAFDHDGQLLWARRLTDDFGPFAGRHGIGSSLRLCSAGLLAFVAHEGPSYLACLNRASGETVWMTDRDPGVSWSTPVLARHGGREVVLASGGDRVEAYAASDGSLLWTHQGHQGAFVASPTPVPGGAIIGSSSKGKTASLRFGPTADSQPEVAWRAENASSYFSSPLVVDGRVFMVNKAGVAFCLAAESGRELWHERLAGACWASTLASQGHVYFFGVDGLVEVFLAADEVSRVASSSISEESRLYGVAISESALLLRYGRRLVCVREA